MRLRGDYREQAILTREQVAPFLKLAESFINAIKDYLQESGQIWSAIDDLNDLNAQRYMLLCALRELRGEQKRRPWVTAEIAEVK